MFGMGDDDKKDDAAMPASDGADMAAPPADMSGGDDAAAPADDGMSADAAPAEGGEEEKPAGM